MIEAIVVEAIVGLAGTVTVVAAVVRPRSRPAKSPPLARAVARLPGRHRRRVRRIVAIAREHDGRHPGDSPDGFTSRETLARYLPETIDAYLAVPKALRAVRAAGGRSPDDEFVRQLRTLRAGLERLQAIDGRAAASRLDANGTFLDERFGPPGLEPPSEFASLSSGVVRSALAAWMRRAGIR